MLLFSPRRKDLDTPITNLQYGLGHISLLIPDLNPMQPLNPHFLPLIGDRVPAIARQAIHAGAHQEVGSGGLRSTEEFIDVALAVANVDTALPVCQSDGGRFQILQPANAFFLFNGHPCGIDLLFEGIASFKLASRPELDGSQSQRYPFGGDGQTGMHQQTAKRMQTGTTFSVLPHVSRGQQPDR